MQKEWGDPNRYQGKWMGAEILTRTTHPQSKSREVPPSWDEHKTLRMVRKTLPEHLEARLLEKRSQYRKTPISPAKCTRGGGPERPLTLGVNSVSSLLLDIGI